VLQAWSKGSTTQHLVNLAFVLMFGVAAVWGFRTIFRVGP
jgi:hypothetical protein